MQRARLLPLLMLLPLLVSLFPAAPAAAQAETVQTSLTVLVPDPGEELLPSRPTGLTVTVRYRWSPGATASEPTEVLLSVDRKPEWSNAVIEPARLLFPIMPEAQPAEDPPVQTRNGPIGGTLERTASINVTIAGEAARAFDRQNFTVRAIAQPNGNLAGAEAVSAPIGLMPAYQGKLNLTAPEAVQTRGGRSSAVEVTVTNVGNGATTVEWAVPLQPEESILDEAPEPITLQPGESRTVTLKLRTPWNMPALGDLVVEATPVAVEDPEAKGLPSSVTVRVEGMSALPGPSVSLILLGLGALAAIRRR